MKHKFYALHLNCALGPRRNPWFGAPDEDHSAAPFRDSYLRAGHACYGPNTSAALRGENGLIAELRNNFERVSFNAGPELLALLETAFPRVYAELLEADRRQSAELGHGGALAAAYPPLILPLTNRADKRTVVRWGIGDFRARFGREPEGMWLPENAVDDETCEILIEEGIRFTVVARTQAGRVRPLGAGDEDWTEVDPERVDPRRPYRWLSRETPGRWLGIFLNRSDLSPRRMLTRNALAEDDAVAVDACQGFANKLVDSLTANEAAELAHLAMDAEWFGLIHPYGERALAYTLDILEREAPARRSNYAAFLDLFPPPQEIELKPVSARSCPHGVERWRAECACRHPGAPDKSPAWRRPLRQALEEAAHAAAEAVAALTQNLTHDSLASLDAAAPLLFSADASGVDSFLAAAARRHPTPAEARRLVRAVEIRRASLAALGHWTWQGEDGASQEVIQALSEAARAVAVLGLEAPARAAALEASLLRALADVPAGDGADGAEIYRRHARVRAVDARRQAAHAALFASVLDRLPRLTPLEAPYLRFSTRLLCRRDRPQRGTGREGDGVVKLHIFEVRTDDRKVFDSFSGLSAVLDGGGTSFECWVGTVSDPEAAASELETVFVKSGLEAFRAAAAEALGRETWGLDGLLGESRRFAIRNLSPRTRSRPDAGRRDGARLRETLLGRAAAFAASPTEKTLTPLVRRLRAVCAAEIPVNIWEIRDLGLRGLRGADALPETGAKALLSLLNLAEESLAGEHPWSRAN